MKLVLRIAAVLLLLCVALPAAAQSLDQAKAAGQVGERIDGYVGVVAADAPADIRAMVDRVNAERREKYAEIAAERGISVQAVGQIAGQKLIERAPQGEYVLGADGQWRRK
ncbi:MAG TPA: YdbL family protein [Geminicoccaceae bacterium]|nr:YdbL family protein [Geminicoccaceae bacterium]